MLNSEKARYQDPNVSNSVAKHLGKSKSKSKNNTTTEPMNSPSVIWITGFSGAGKTTVGRKVTALLCGMSINTVFLDGDDLRGIFAGKWSYERSDRIELSYAYFRLCNTLAAQGITIVISAVSMYHEIYHWVKTNIDQSLQAYLKVPEQERIARDKNTKNIYGTMGDLTKLYDEPTSPDITIENFGDTTPEATALKIVEMYKTVIDRSSADKGRTTHWNSYYAKAKLVFEPSSFATTVQEKIEPSIKIIEMGCGNGRDSAYFSSLGHDVTALDPSTSAIELCKKKHDSLGPEFINGTLPSLDSSYNSSFNVVYSRFVLHAMTEKEEIENLASAHRLLKHDGNFYIECRSINDPLARKGEIISATERIHGHYRRFIILDDIKKRLTSAGFKFETAVESNDLAILGDENPVVLRIHARKI
ncbi:MAG: adenylyl-sulfate kinase [Candidatus Endonucleobacter bathymodioli]|uniref:Adenylyl-sulfate kinase n=1 Tax=Candidatus Endonucleibacter bathymodioli TaxID=539814 RepID=A0AA90SNK5_9GAMM|nr:adenylyl-sulfate kinase [Candidatus Endonucleobacter bathymodioli]